MKARGIKELNKHLIGGKGERKLKLCKIEGCGKETTALSLCNMHYKRFKRGEKNMSPKRIVAFNLREKNGNWKGSNATISTGRIRAERWFSLGKCELCNNHAQDRHHRDGNSLNNHPLNIQLLCRRCHMVIDGRMGKWVSLERTRTRGLNGRFNGSYNRCKAPRSHLSVEGKAEANGQGKFL